MLGFIWWLIIGVIAGGIARLIVPGRQPMGLLWTMLLGLIGSFVGGFVSSLIFGYDPLVPGFHTSGLLMSTLGAIAVLAGYVAVKKKRAADG